jgi:hypothetical protein
VVAVTESQGGSSQLRRLVERECREGVSFQEERKPGQSHKSSRREAETGPGEAERMEVEAQTPAGPNAQRAFKCDL